VLIIDALVSLTISLKYLRTEFISNNNVVCKIYIVSKIVMKTASLILVKQKGNLELE